MKKLFLFIMPAVIIGLLSFPSTGHSAIVYENEVSQYSQGTGFSGASNISLYIAADDFILENNTMITGASADVTDGPTADNARWDGTVEWWILSDNSGKPGTVLASGIGKNIAETILNTSASGTRHLVVDFDFGQGVPLIGGTKYWLALHFQADYERISVSWEYAVAVKNNVAYSGGELSGGVPVFTGKYGGPVPSGADLTFKLTTTEKFRIPIRFCAVQGSPAAASPNMDNVLLQRLQRLTDNIWANGAAITFQSALPANTNAHFPVINDPYTPAQGGAGAIGDILDVAIADPRGGDKPQGRELKEAVNSCDAAWKALGISKGPIVINLNNYVDTQGKNTYLGGFGNPYLVGVNFCKLSGIFSNEGAYAGVVDNSFTLSSDPHDQLLAHELGHVLFLGHGNGIDDDMNGLYDNFCDENENPSATPVSLMSPTGGNDTITPLQRKTARAVAKVTSGATASSSKAKPADTRGDHLTDPVHDVPDDSVDITSVGMIENTATGTTMFFHSVFGMLPFPGSHQYLIFADLDKNSATGGAPSTLGFPTSFTGAEIVTRVLVSGDAEFRQVVPTIWSFENGVFVEVNDPQIEALVTTMNEAETGIALSDVISILLPSSILGVPVTQARIQAIAEQLTTGQLDRLPDGPLDGGLDISMIPPEYPECEVIPKQAYPGQQVTITASGLLAGQLAKVFFGNQEVAETTVDSNGNAIAYFLIPYPSVTGMRLISVAVAGTALSAGNLVEILESLNIPPIADAGPDQTVERTSPAGAQVQLAGSSSSDPEGKPLTYEWTWSGGSVSGVNPTVTLPMGQSTITLTVSDGELSATDTVVITVVDTTSPQITIITPSANQALQDGVTFQSQATDISGVDKVLFSVREPNGGQGISIGFDDLDAKYNTTSGYWEYAFDTTKLLDGYYIIFAKATDTLGNEGMSSVVPFGIRNWAVITILPSTANNKAGRTMPVKFSLRIAASVDPAQPFVYNEDLEIRIYDAKAPGTILQRSVFGTGSTDYRINVETYITNFKTGKTPATFVVEIWRPSKNFLVGSFTFKTVK